MSKDNIDIKTFHTLLSEKRQILVDLCGYWTVKLSEIEKNGFPEEVAGLVRTAIGQCTIFVAKNGRLAQFESLVNNYENEFDGSHITFSDLQGFWELIMIQVEEVISSFKEIEAVESNDWKIEPKSPMEVVEKQPASGEKAIKNKQLVKAKSSSQLREHMTMMRKAMADKMLDNSPKGDVLPTILVDAAVDKKRTFDGGFFKICSPVRSNQKSPDTPKSSGNRSDALRRSVLQPTTPFAIVKVSQQLRLSVESGEKGSPKKLFNEDENVEPPPAKTFKVE